MERRRRAGPTACSSRGCGSRVLRGIDRRATSTRENIRRLTMDPGTIETLEVGDLKKLLARHVQTPMGQALVAQLEPQRDPAPIERALDLVAECRRYLAAGEGFGLAGLGDPAPALALLKIEDVALAPHQIVLLERLAAAAADVRASLRRPEARELYPTLAELGARVPDLRELLQAVRGKILPDGGIDDNASPQLRAIRKELQVVRERIHRHLESIMRCQPQVMQEELVTFRNDRFVIPVRTDSRTRLPGVVHGLSSSGQTTYVEPLAVIDENNELVRLREEEQLEVARILANCTEVLRRHRDALHAAAALLAELDLAQAKARLADDFGCVRPALSSRRYLRLCRARHILLDDNLRKAGARAVPITLELDPSRRVLIVSGPNAGGKTVVLKTVGLISLMAQMGMHVPAAEAELPVFSAVYADIGDQQSIAANLSTFTAHMRNVAETARRVTPSALVLIDEVGTGTDPDEGAALAIAIVDYFRRSGAITLTTTHYNQLKMWAAGAEGVINACVEFDETTLRPTYRLMLGIAGASSGLQIAERMAVPRSIIEQSRGLLDPRRIEAEEYLKQIKRRAEEMEEQYRRLEQERADLARRMRAMEEEHARGEQERRAQFETMLANIAAEFRVESERLIAGLKDRLLAESARRAAARAAGSLRRKSAELSARAAASVPALSRKEDGAGPAALYEPRAGDRVRVTSLDKEGFVELVQGDSCTVAVGPLKYHARRDEIEPAGSVPPLSQAETPRPAPPVQLDAEDRFVRELNVIGMTADEAVERVDKFIDAAYFAGVESVRIIHGHGRGVLRRAIARLLTGHRQVRRFQPAPAQQGGGGATVVELQD